jgi:hypothetical protein
MGVVCSTHDSDKYAYKVLVGRPEGKRPLVNIGRNGRTILELILEKWGRKLWTGFIWLRIGTISGYMVITVRVSKKCGEFSDKQERSAESFKSSRKRLITDKAVILLEMASHDTLNHTGQI